MTEKIKFVKMLLNPVYENFLGSASFITDATGYVDQHVQYLPFGELFISQRNSTFDKKLYSILPQSGLPPCGKINTHVRRAWPKKAKIIMSPERVRCIEEFLGKWTMQKEKSKAMTCFLWMLHDVAPSALFAGCVCFYHRTSPCGIDICPLGKKNTYDESKLSVHTTIKKKPQDTTPMQPFFLISILFLKTFTLPSQAHKWLIINQLFFHK